MPEKAARPTQVTIAAWLVMSGSVFVVLTAFDQIAGLHTLETREAVEEFLSDGLGKSLGLDVQGMLSVMRVLTMVTAACATASAILGYQVLRRSRSARLVLSILAAPLFLAGVVVGGLIPSMVVGAIIMLWFQPARDWIDGKAPQVAPPAPTPQAPVAPPSPPVAPTFSSEPRAVPGFGDARSLLASLPPPRTAAIGARPARPTALTVACILAWVGSGIAFVVMLTTVVLVVASPELLVDELYRQNPSLEDDGMTIESLRSTMLLAGTVLMLWSLTAIVLAAYTWRGRSWAWSALLVSALSAAILCLLATLTNPGMLLPLAFCAAGAALLLRPEVRAYVRHLSAR